MLRLTTIRGCGVLTALALLALGGPAAADTKGTLAIVNGIPGTRVDVCVNDREIRSGLRYGGAVLRDVIGTGNKRLRFYARDPRRCRGTLLAQRDVVLDPGEDLTIVATRRAPKVVIFANVGLGEIPPVGPSYPAGSPYAWRHAAEPAVNFRARSWNAGPETPITPDADPVWTKGDEFVSGSAAGLILQVRATLPEQPGSIAGPTLVVIGTSHRYEWILVGSNPRNTRFVVLDRVVSQPSP